jgi:GDP/UDP-N,N'-diacetylbacillosamine 2-epimerase (hydrolysing)
MCYKIAFLTGSRSDFGLIQSIIMESVDDDRFDSVLIRVGHSLVDNYDYCEDFKNLETHIVDTKEGISNIRNELEVPLSLSEIIKKSGDLLNVIKPDIVFAPGDRFEMFGIVISAYYQRIPIAHIFGGDRSTGGHLDDNVRHAITKLSSLHFTVCEDSKERVLKLGEQDNRVFNYGSPVVDNLKNISSQRPTSDKYVILTYHTITGFPERSYQDTLELLKAVASMGMLVFVTSTNNEYGSLDIIRAIRESTKKYDNILFVGSLGWKKYLNYLKFAEYSIGNSSSNLLESPIVGTPSINVGDRQQGRYSPDSVTNVDCNYDLIIGAIRKILSDKDQPLINNHPYGSGHVGIKVLDSIEHWLSRGDILFKKMSY